MARDGFLELEGVQKAFGGTAVLEGLDLDIRRGEFVTLLGPSGCGKTTTLRLIAGFMPADAGTIRLDGRLLSGAGVSVPPEKRGIGLVFQSYAVWPHMTVRQNVGLPLRIRKQSRAQIEARVAEVLRLCRLDGLADRAPHQLSGGQLQRVALARALVYDPPLVLLDEPLSNLDVELREELRRELYHLHRTLDTTFVLVTHDQVEAMSLSDRVVVMRQGRIEQVGAPQDIYANPQTEFVARFLGSANMLQGVVADAAWGPGGAACLVQAGPLRLSVRAWAGARLGEAVSLALHPEAIRLGAAGPDRVAEGVVQAAFFLGRTQEVLIALDGLELRAMQVRGQGYKPGDRVGVGIPADAAIAIGRPPMPAPASAAA